MAVRPISTEKKRVFLDKTIMKDMATYTVTINERTKAGKSLVSYLRSLGVIDEPNATTMAAHFGNP